HFGDRRGVDPAVGARPADIIKVIINTGTAAALTLFGRGQTAQVAPVIIAPQQNDIVWNAHATFVKALHFFVESPNLGHLADFAVVENFGNNLALVTDNFFQQAAIFTLAHRGIFLAARPRGINAFIGLVTLGSFGPEVVQSFGIG